MRRTDPSDNLKGFIGFRIVILFVLIFVALLLGVLYFKLLPTSITSLFNSKVAEEKKLESINNEKIAEFTKSFESSPSENSPTQYELLYLTNLLDSLEEKEKLTAQVVTHSEDLMQVTLKISDGTVIQLPVYSSTDYYQRLAFPDSYLNEQILLVFNKEVGQPVKLQEKVFVGAKTNLVGKDVEIKYFNDLSNQDNKLVKFVGVFYE